MTIFNFFDFNRHSKYSVISTSNHGEPGDITLKMIIKNTKSCKLFIEDLSSRLSSNLLLSVIEFSEYQNTLIKNGRAQQNMVNNKLMFISSKSIHNEHKLCNFSDNSNDYKSKAFKLYKKYIAENSEHEISISNELKKKK
eukprot:211679_1